MSLIVDALRKAESKATLAQPNRAGSRSLWIYRLLFLGSIGLVVLSSGLLIRQLKLRSPIPSQRTLPVKDAVTANPAPPSVLSNALFPAKHPLRLTGVLLSADGERLAIINRQVLGEGETVQGTKLVRINEDSVELDQQGEHSVVRLND